MLQRMDRRQIRAIGLLPFTASAVIPAILIYIERPPHFVWSLPMPLKLVLPILGVLFVVVGLILWLRSVISFATIGEGTLAPWDPPKKLVVSGVFRYVRNPMISGVSILLLGEAAFFGSLNLFYWFIAFVLVNAVYIQFIEEPRLVRRFGYDYILYKQHVPRWIPRLKPWQGPGAGQGQIIKG